MRKSFVLSIVVLTGILLTAYAMAAVPLKLKFVQSVYEDGNSLGLRHPEGVACTNDSFIVGDTGNDRLIKYTYQEKVANPTALEMPVTAPVIVQVNSKGKVYALDGRDRRIAILNADGTGKGYLVPKGSPVARKMVPKSFKIDKKDNIYILDLSEGLVLVLDSGGKYLRHIILPEHYGFFSDLAIDKQGTVFIVDSTKPAVYSAAQGVEQFTKLTKELQEYTNFPTNIEVDNSGVIYLIDKHGGNLALLSPDGSFLGHKFGYGWKEAQFYYPSQMCIADNGAFFIADRNNSRVQIFEAEE